MLEYERQRKLVVLCVLAIIVVIVLAILYIIGIWMPEPEKEKVFEVGQVEYVKVTDEDVLLQHYETISKLLMNSDIDKLCSLVTNDYLKYNDYTLEDVKKYIEDKNIMNKAVELVNSAIYSIDGYSNVFYLDIKAMGEMYSIGVVVKEYAPGDYEIAFDKFVDYSTESYDSMTNSVNLRVLRTVRFTNSVEYRVRITNGYDKPVTINSDKATAGLILVSSSSQNFKQPIMLDFANQAVTIGEGQAREYNVSYNITEDIDYLLYKVMVLRGVSYTGLTGTSDLEFKLK